MARRNNLLVFRGEDALLSFTQDPVEDITGWTIVLTVKRYLTDVAPLFTANATLTSPLTGQYTAAMSAAQTGALTPGPYLYEVTRVNTGSVAVLSIGNLVVASRPGAAIA